jgi:hypothetical protein
MERLIWLAALIGLVVQCDARAQTAPLSKIEARRLSEAKLRQRILAQLDDVLVADLYKGRPGIAPRRPLTDVGFHTRPRAANVAGVCTADWLRFDLSPVESDRGAATAMAVSGVTASRRYHLRRPITADEIRYISDEDRIATDADCRAIDPEKVNFIVADDDILAVEGAAALRDILSSTRNGVPEFTLDCGSSRKPCNELLRSINVAALNEVERCGWFSSLAGQNCLTLDTGDFRIKVVSSYKDRRIVSVDIDEMIILSHERID